MLVQHSLLDNGSQIKSIVRPGLLLNGGRKHTMNVLLIILNVVATSNYRRIVKISFSVRVARKIVERQKEYVTRCTIDNCRHRMGLKPFHVIRKPLKTETHISDRLWLCDRLKNWTQEDFLHLAPADEFFVWSIRKSNHQNDRIWAKSIEDIEEDERYREMVQNQACVGIFIIFTAKILLWVIKDKGESWASQYFRDTILVRHVFPFLKNEENVIDVDGVTFVHDKAPCMKANITQ
jgi:hypothetical protein